MKLLIPVIILTAIISSKAAHAAPGFSVLTCQSAKNSGSKQTVGIFLRRANSEGWISPKILVTVNNRTTELTTPESLHYGSTFHNSPLKVILATINVPGEENTNSGYASIAAIPETVQAFNVHGQAIKWSLENEKDECNDANGSAKFQAIIHGGFDLEQNGVEIETQILDCTLSYNSGSAC